MPEQVVDGALFSPDVRELLSLLASHRVRYMIVGGEAAIYYGHIRLTGGTDIFFDARPANARRLFQTLQAFWNGTVPGVRSADELTEDGLILQFGRPPQRPR